MASHHPAVFTDDGTWEARGLGMPLSRTSATATITPHADRWCAGAFKEPSLGNWVITVRPAEASFKRGKGEVGMDEYQVRTWQGWHQHMALA